MEPDITFGGLRRRAGEARLRLRDFGDKTSAFGNMAYVGVMALIQIAQELNEIKLLVKGDEFDPFKEWMEATVTPEDSIEVLHLPVRARNNLIRANIITVGDLLSKTESYLVSIPNMGKIAMTAIKESLELNNLKLKEEDSV